ncbi:ion transporter [Flavobacterium sp.]|uniref:ion transporter n=1 Tax=Flavobacterium sp. TaxID=239 RepID=UPI002FDB170D
MNETQEKLTFLNILLFVLSIYVLGALLIDTLWKLPEETSRLLNHIDNAICIVFLLDFVIRLNRAKNKLHFMKWGWIDLLSSIPAVDFLRAGRVLRLIRIFRILRAFRSTKQIVSHVFRNRAQGTFTSVSILAILLVLFSAIAILQVEKDPESNIKTAEDALWWAYVTITTVGYGDKFPITTEGRFIAVVLMTGGVGLFGTFTAFASSWFLTDKKNTI